MNVQYSQNRELTLYEFWIGPNPVETTKEFVVGKLTAQFTTVYYPDS